MSNAFVLWLTGLPASGKSEIAEEVASYLKDRGLQVEVINSGKLRRTPLGATLGFSKNDRETNVRRHAIAAKLLMQNNVIAIVSSVSPYRKDRDAIRVDLKRYIEVYVSTPTEVCKKLDKTGNWQRAEKGEILNFTGLSDPYEAPVKPEVNVNLANCNIKESGQRVIEYLQKEKWIKAPSKIADPAEEIARKLRLLGYSDQDHS
jgi:adenylylsulfate kinase